MSATSPSQPVPAVFLLGSGYNFHHRERGGKFKGKCHGEERHTDLSDSDSYSLPPMCPSSRQAALRGANLEELSPSGNCFFPHLDEEVERFPFLTPLGKFYLSLYIECIICVCLIYLSIHTHIRPNNKCTLFQEG